MNIEVGNNNGQLYRFLLDNGNLRGAYIEATGIVKAMRKAHGVGILETLALGQAYIAAGLLTANLKGNDRLMLQVDCSGPLKGFSVETNAVGQIRGYLKNNNILLDKPLESFDLSPFYGQGILSLSKHLENSKAPYTGQAILRYSMLAKDLAFYFYTSEQIPTAFILSVYFDQNGEVAGAGGLYLQAMPGADTSMLDTITTHLESMPSLGKVLSRDGSLLRTMETFLGEFTITFLEMSEVSFFCPCSKERFLTVLKGFSKDKLTDFMAGDEFPVHTTCHYCGSQYPFEKSEIEALVQ